MKRPLLGAAALALLVAGSANAQPYGHDRDHGRDDRGRFDHRDDRGGDRGFHRYGRGERLDRRYGDYAEVRDWRTHRLRAPPRGYHWVRHGNDYVLAAVATGLIASVIANSSY